MGGEANVSPFCSAGAELSCLTLAIALRIGRKSRCSSRGCACNHRVLARERERGFGSTTRLRVREGGERRRTRRREREGDKRRERRGTRETRGAEASSSSSLVRLLLCCCWWAAPKSRSSLRTSWAGRPLAPAVEYLNAWLCLQSSCIGTRERERERLWGVQQDCVFGRERERDDPYEAQTASTSSSKLLEKLAPRIATWYLFVEERATE